MPGKILEIGDVVGVILGKDQDGTIIFLGYGEYAGYQEKGNHVEIDEFKKTFKVFGKDVDNDTVEETYKKIYYGHKIKLYNGSHIYTSECVWYGEMNDCQKIIDESDNVINATLTRSSKDIISKFEQITYH